MTYFLKGKREEPISRGKKKASRRTLRTYSARINPLLLPSAIVSAVLLAAVVIVLLPGSGYRVSDGFIIKPGGLAAYAGDPESAAFLHFQSKDGDAWGFFEYPEPDYYGFFTGSRSKDGTWQGRIHAGADTVRFRFFQGFLGIGTSIVLEPEGKPSFSLKLKRLRPRSLFGIESYEPRKTGTAASEDRIEIVQMDSARRSYSDLLDSRLRRSEDSLENARSLLQEFKRSSGRLPQHSGGVTLMQRPYLLYFNAPYASIASETYIFQGGAHGITVSVFNTINMETGRLMEPPDFFTGDWQTVLPELLAGEAARRLAGAAVPGRKADAVSLSGFGLFEDELPIPSGIFPCASGFGFHYNRYEIAPGSMGDFLFLLPYSALDKVLKPEWKK